MAELNPVSDSHALLESMLQKLQLNSETSSSPAKMQTCSLSETMEDSSNTKLYPFGSPSKSKEQDRRTSVCNKCENPCTQQSYCEGALMPKQPVRRICKHNSGFSTKPKRPPLIWREHAHLMPERTDEVTARAGDNQMPRPEKTSSNLAQLHKTESFRTTPDVLSPTTSSSTVEEPEVKGQSSNWRWVAENDKIECTKLNEQRGKVTKTSRKRWAEAKRWTQNMKERWRERHGSTMTGQREVGERPTQNEVQSNLLSSSGPIDVNNTPTAPAETTEIHHEVIKTAMEEDGPASLSNMSDCLLSFGTTSDLMEEIFSGTEWAQFLCTTQDQSNEPQSNINQSREEKQNSKWTHNDTTHLNLGRTKPLLNKSFVSDKSVNNQTETLQMSVPSHVTDLITNPLQTSDPFTNKLQNANLKFNKSHHSEQSYEQSQFSQLDSNESKATERSDPQLMLSQLSNPNQSGTEDFILLSDLSDIKPMDRSSTTFHRSLGRKREHWTKRRDPFEQTIQDTEDADHSSSFLGAQASDSVRNVSSNSQMESSVSLETAVKKRRMENTRRVRFSEEVIVFQPRSLPEDEDDKDDDEDNDFPEEPSPRPSYPKWIVALKSKSAKYKL